MEINSIIDNIDKNQYDMEQHTSEYKNQDSVLIYARKAGIKSRFMKQSPTKNYTSDDDDGGAKSINHIMLSLIDRDRIKCQTHNH